MATRNPLAGMLRVIVCALGLLTVPVGAAGAAELQALDISNRGSVYSVHLEIVLDVLPEYVMAVLTDYRHIYRLNPSIVDSRLLPSPGVDIERVMTRMAGCVLFYCNELTRVEDVRTTGTGKIVADSVPELGDFGAGTTVWQVSGEPRGSRLVYEATLQPETFIPPLFGSMIFRQKLREEVLTTMQRIECNAMTRQVLTDPAHGTASTAAGYHRLC